MARIWRGLKSHVIRHLRVSCIAFVISITCGDIVLAAEEAPQSFTYQGRFFNAAGTSAIADGTYTVKFSIYDPSGSCLLYQESQSVTTSNGFFSTQVGSAVADLKRVAGTDPTLSMQDVFSNKIKAVRPVAAPNCAAGYIPALGDGRKLKVENVTLGVVLSPDQTISSVPHAIVAESIQGITPQNFVQIYPTGLPAAGTTLSDDTIAADGADAYKMKQWDSTTGTWAEIKVLHPNSIHQAGAAAQQVLKWDGTNWAPGNDLDTAAGTMNGDVIGSYSATKVIALQNRPVAATAPAATEVLTWNGTAWAPAAAGGPPSGAAGGDLLGTYPAPYVSKIHGIAITSSVPNSGDVLKYDGATWVYTSSSTTGGVASGDLSGTYPGPTVAKLQGNAVASGAPTAPGQVLTWTGTEWAAASSNTLSDNLYVNITGDTMTGHLRVANSLTATGTIYSDSNIQMNATAINGLANPTLAQDAVTKIYADSKLGSLNLDTTGVATGGTGAGMFLKWDGNKWIADTVPAGNPGTVTAVVEGHGIIITGDSITSSGTVTADTLTLSTRTYAASKLGGLDLDTTGVATGGTGTDYALKWDGNKWVTYDPQATNDARYVNTAGDTMTGKLTMNDNIVMAGHTITQLGLSSETDSATNKAYVDAVVANSAANYVRIAGDTMTGHLRVANSLTATGTLYADGFIKAASSISATGTIYSNSDIVMNSTKVTAMADPTAAQDAATKMYVDSKLGSLAFDTAGVATGGTGAGMFLKWDGNKWIADTIPGGNPGTVTAVVAGHGISITGDSITSSGAVTADTLTLSTRTYAASKLGGLDLDTTGVATGGTGTDYALKWDGNKWVTFDPVAANDSRYVNTAGDTMTGKLTMNDNIVMAGHTITQLGTSSETDSATNKAYVDAVVSNATGAYVLKTGDTMTGHLRVANSLTSTGTLYADGFIKAASSISATGVIYSNDNIVMNSTKVTGMADPTAAQDAATKMYVDSKLGSLAFDTVGVATDGTGTGKFLKWDGDNWVADTIPGGNPGTVTAVVAGHGISITGDSITSSGAVTADTLTLSTRTYAASKLGGLDLDTTGVATGGTGTDYALKWDGNKWVTYDPQTSGDSRYVNTAGDTMTGALMIPAGTAALPSLTFAGDPNTGMFSSGADTLSFSTAGTARVTIDSQGYVGVGNASPTQKLDISGAIKIGTTSDSSAGVIRWTGSDFEGFDGSTWKSMTGVGAGAGDMTGVSAGHGLSGGGLSGDVTLTADTLTLSTRTYAASKLGGLDLDTNGVATGGTGTDYSLKWDGNKWVTYNPQSTNDARYVNTAGDTMTGKLTMNDNIVMAGHTITQLGTSSETDSATNKAYVDAVVANSAGNYVRIAGDTMTGHLRVANSLTATGTLYADGFIKAASSISATGIIYSNSDIVMNSTKVTGMADPTAAQDAATKMYVDSKLGSLAFDTVGVATDGTGAGKFLKWDGDNWVADTVPGGNLGTVTAVVAGHGITITGSSITSSGAVTADTLTLSTRTYAASKLGGLDLDTTGVATGGTGTDYALKWDGNKWVTYDPQAANDSRYVNAAGDTMTGKLTMNDNIVMAGHTITQLGLSSETDSATNKAYVDALIANVGGSISDFVRKSGDTMTGLLKVGSSMHVTSAVGIGTTAPQTKLHVVGGATDTVFVLENSAAPVNKRVRFIETTSTGAMHFGRIDDDYTSNGIENMTITDTGNIGIGITSASTALDVNGAFSMRGIASVPATSGAGNSRIYTDTSGVIQVSQNNGAYAPLATTSSLANYVLKTGDTMSGLLKVGSSMHVTGNVGIGTTSPDQALHIYKENSNSVLKVSSLADLGSAVSEIRSESYDLGGYGSSVHSKISIVTSEGDPTSPTSVLSGRTVGALRFMTNNAGTDYDLAGVKANTHPITYDGANRRTRLTFYTTSLTTPEDRMTIDYNGNVGIGTLSPTAVLQLKAGTATANTAPLKFTSGTNLTAVEDGAMEFDGADYYLSAAGVRKKILVSSGGTSDFVLKSGDTMTGLLNVGSSMHVTGNVGIGTTTPSESLEITGNLAFSTGAARTLSVRAPAVNSAGYALTIKSGDATFTGGPDNKGGKLYLDGGLGTGGGSGTDGDVLIATNTSSSKVGIGASTPNELLTIGGRVSFAETAAPAATANYGKLYVKSADSKLYFMDDGGLEYPLSTSTGGYVAKTGDSMSGLLQLVNIKTSNLFSWDAGNGTDSAGSGVNVYGGAGDPSCGGSYCPGGSIKIYGGAAGGGGSVDGDVILGHTGTVARGKVGIGTTSPTYALSFGGDTNRNIGMERTTAAATPGYPLSINAGGAKSGETNQNGGDLNLVSGAATGTGSSNITFSAATSGASGTGNRLASVKMTLLGSGDLGIGTTGPDARLHIKGAGQTSASFSTTGALTNAVILDDSGSAVGNGGAILFAAGNEAWRFASIKGYVRDGSNNSTGDITIGTRRVSTDATLTEAMRIEYTGEIGIGASDPTTALDLNGAFTIRGVTAPAVAPADQARLYYDTATDKLKISLNGGAYSDLGGSSGVQWMGYTAATAGHMGGTTRGIKGANTLCNAAYSGSHACRLDEIIDLGTSYPYSSAAWVIDGSYVSSDGTSAYQSTSDGYTTSTSNALYPMCNGWQSNGVAYYGPYMNTSGMVALQACNGSLALPCCK